MQVNGGFLNAGALALDSVRRERLPALLRSEQARVARIRAGLADSTNGTVDGELYELLHALRRTPVPKRLAPVRALDACVASSQPELIDRAWVPGWFKRLEIRNLDFMNRVYGNYARWSRLLTRTLGQRSGRLHDLGAGSGGFYRYLAAQRADAAGFQLVSSDLDVSTTEAGARIARDNGLPVRFEQRDATQLSDLAGHVDLFTLTSAAHHLSPSLLIKVMQAATQAAGKGLLIVDPLRSLGAFLGTFLSHLPFVLTWANLWDGPQSVRRCYAPSELLLLAEVAGLSADARFEAPIFTAVHITARA